MIPESGQIPIRFPESTLTFETMDITPSNRGIISALRRSDHWPHFAFALVGAAQSGLSTIAYAWATERAGYVYDSISLPSTRDAEIEAQCGGAIAIDRVDLVADEKRLLWIFSCVERLNGRLLLTAQTPPHLWSASSPDLRSRFKAMPVGDLGKPDEALMRARIKRACHRAYLKLPANVEDFLVTRLGLDYAGIERAIVMLDGAVGEGRALSIPLVKDVLELDDKNDDLFNERRPK